MFRLKTVSAHCDLPCGVYDPAQARIEAESVVAIQEKMAAYEGDDRMRALLIKEERAELVKHHVMVLWADYFKPEHADAHPELHELVWQTLKQASDCKHHSDPETGRKLVGMIDQIADIFHSTKK